MTNLATALREIETWPIDDQIELVQTVWDRLVDSGWQPELSDELRDELDRRLDAHEANPQNVIRWDR